MISIVVPAYNEEANVEPLYMRVREMVDPLRPEEWGNRNFYSAYDAIAALRPMWLNKRGPDGEVQVYVDENHVGGVEMLRTQRTASISIMRHLDGIQASARYGLGHDQGAILISTRATGR